MNRIFLAILVAGGALLAPVTVGGQARPSCDPDNGGLTLPAGFCALVIADNLGVARNLAVAANGDVCVSIRTGPRAQIGRASCRERV